MSTDSSKEGGCLDFLVKEVKKIKKTKKLVEVMIVIILLVCSLVLIFHNSIRDWMVAQNQKRYQIGAVSVQKIDRNKEASGNFDTTGVKTVNFLDVAKAQMENKNYPIIGAISYPALKISLPIFNGDGDTTMLYGCGTMKEGQQMGQGNYALASHHVSNVIGHSGDGLLFSPLVNAEKDQAIYLTDKTNVYEYKTDKVFQVTPEEGQVILDKEDKKEITLITCATDDTYRIVVQGHLVERRPFDEQTAQMFSSKFTQYWH